MRCFIDCFLSSTYVAVIDGDISILAPMISPNSLQLTVMLWRDKDTPWLVWMHESREMEEVKKMDWLIHQR